MTENLAGAVTWNGFASDSLVEPVFDFLPLFRSIGWDLREPTPSTPTVHVLLLTGWRKVFAVAVQHSDSDSEELIGALLRHAWAKLDDHLLPPVIAPQVYFGSNAGVPEEGKMALPLREGMKAAVEAEGVGLIDMLDATADDAFGVPEEMVKEGGREWIMASPIGRWRQMDAGELDSVIDYLNDEKDDYERAIEAVARDPYATARAFLVAANYTLPAEFEVPSGEVVPGDVALWADGSVGLVIPGGLVFTAERGVATYAQAARRPGFRGFWNLSQAWSWRGRMTTVSGEASESGPDPAVEARTAELTIPEPDAATGPAFKLAAAAAAAAPTVSTALESVVAGNAAMLEMSMGLQRRARGAIAAEKWWAYTYQETQLQAEQDAVAEDGGEDGVA